jgi:hypothetical protein
MATVRETHGEKMQELREQSLQSAALMVAWAAGRGFPCSINDLKNGKAIVTTTLEAISQWADLHTFSSACIYFP